jgi:hypothetical protein
MGLLERDGKTKLTVIGENSFKEVVRQYEASSEVEMTDPYKSYIGLKEEFQAHETVNHYLMEFIQGTAYTNSVEGFILFFTRSIF